MEPGFLLQRLAAIQPLREDAMAESQRMFIRGEISNAVLLSLLVGELALAALWLAHG